MVSRGSILVGLQFAGIAITGYAAAQSIPPINYTGFSISLLGACLGIYTLGYNKIGNFNISPTLKPEATLVTTGPYGLIRHPMYLSVVLFLLGLCIQAGGLMIAWVGLLVSTSAMLGKSEMEEQQLLARFSDYEAYQAQTKKLIPFLY